MLGKSDRKESGEAVGGEPYMGEGQEELARPLPSPGTVKMNCLSKQ